MKRYIIFILICFTMIWSGLNAQNQANSWVNFNQTYYRLSIVKTGMYKITKQYLLDAGVPVNNYNLHDIQLFFKGKQIPCYVEGTTSLEYIEFFAEKNDGWFDVDMHNKQENQINPYYSYINDTASVFLTWSSTGEHKRFELKNDNNFADYSPLKYCWIKFLEMYPYRYYGGETNCEYTKGEGWADYAIIEKGKLVNKTIQTPNIYKSDDVNAKIEFALLTFSSGQHHLNISSNGFLVDTSFVGYITLKSVQNVKSSELENSNTIAFKSTGDTQSKTDNSAVAYIQAVYPSLFKFGNRKFQQIEIPASETKKSYLAITNFNYDENTFAYDLTNSYRADTKIDNDTLKVLIPPSATSSNIVVVNSKAYIEPASIEKCEFTDHTKGNQSYIIITHPKLMQSADEYKNYRNAYMVNIEELYNQFAYGIQKHPLAIRNFVAYILKNRNVKPKFLFIIGKGVGAFIDNKYGGYRQNKVAYESCLIPPMGTPNSDVILTAKIGSDVPYSAIPIGRLSATNNNEVSSYLKKVKEFEANKPAEWMKRAIHFGGGKSTYEQNLFKSYLKKYENYLSDTLFGGAVSTFLKTTSNPIEITQSDSVEHLINNGISLMNFFGHGSIQGFDQNIDEPKAFSNRGKYPLLIANSCYSGNIFTVNQNSASEQWVLVPNRGTIGFLAVIHEGNTAFLNNYTSVFYKYLSADYYGQSLGKIINETQKAVWKTGSQSVITKNTIQEFTLHGDPAIVLNSFSLPDLVMEGSQVKTMPYEITTQIDSFDLHITLKNIAKAVTDTFTVFVSRTFPNQTKKDTNLVIKGLNYKKELTIRYPIDRIKGVGMNHFFISVDAGTVINEISETNNTYTLSVLISSPNLIATIPYNYSLNPQAPQVLKAYSGNMLAKKMQGVFQIDTTYTFSGNNLESKNITYEGGVVELQHNQAIDEDKVYYWRVGNNSKESKKQIWSTSSFVYKQGETGWIQADYGQIKNNKFNFIVPNAEKKQYDFIDVPKRLSCHNIGSPNSTNYTKIRFAIDEITDYSSCGVWGAFLLVVIDTIDLKTWKSSRKDFGQGNYPHCSSRNRDDLFYVFYANTNGINNLRNTINNEVPDGFHILIYSFNRIAFSNLGEAAYTDFESWGAKNIRFVPDNYPYIFYARKGIDETAVEIIGKSDNEEIDLKVDLKANFTNGTITSVPIGPAQNWQSIEWNAEKKELNPYETFFVKVYGINKQGEKVVLRDSIGQEKQDIADISSKEYPYLQLKFHTKDTVFKTPTQLKWWKVNYSTITDLALNPKRKFEFFKDTLQQGEIGSMQIAIENIGHTKSDSVVVKYWLQNIDNKVFEIKTHKLKPLSKGEFLIDEIKFKTINHSGIMRLWVEINPWSEKLQDYYQPEQNRFNNITNKTFYIKQDDSNPIMDVTFDGVHIMDGDIVSARPEITITLDDENTYLPMNDTADFFLYMKEQKTGIENKIPISGNSQITFLPAELPKNKAKIIYKPIFEKDGGYELRVRAKDATGNSSGKNDYHISFKIINESSITHIFNYPNPFSTSTRFVFELTGTEIPDEIRIDILTITGRVVKVIYQDELGHLVIGRNITQYAWDGCDMYGNPLANGVYFYKVSVRLNGKNVKHRNTDTDQFFKNGFGKMYLMR